MSEKTQGEPLSKGRRVPTTLEAYTPPETAMLKIEDLMRSAPDGRGFMVPSDAIKTIWQNVALRLGRTDIKFATFRLHRVQEDRAAEQTPEYAARLQATETRYRAFLEERKAVNQTPDFR